MTFDQWFNTTYPPETFVREGVPEMRFTFRVVARKAWDAAKASSAKKQKGAA